MKASFEEFTWLFWLHALLIVAAWLSPLLFSWWLVAIGVGAYYAQLILFKGCILTAAEFGAANGDASFYGHYLRRFGLAVDERTVAIVIDYVLPTLLIALAALLQFLYEPLPLII